MAFSAQKTFQDILNEVSDEIMGVSYTVLAADADSGAYRPGITVLKRLVNDAYRQIAATWNWAWIYREDTFNTVADQTTAYDLGTNKTLYEDISWMSIPAQQRKIIATTMSSWEASYPGRYTSVGASIPTNYIRAPEASDGSIQFFLWPQADAIYAVTFGAKLRVANLSAVGDYPLIPPQFQDMLPALAKMKTLAYLGIPSTDIRMVNYKAEFDRIYQLAWLEDQRSAEFVWRFRDRNVENALGASITFPQGTWMTAGGMDGPW